MLTKMEVAVRSKTMLFFILVVGVTSRAQTFTPDSITMQKYPFVKWSQNRIDLAQSSPAFKLLFANMDSLLNGKDRDINIFHIGGSHIQADIYSHRVRRWLHGMNDHTKGERGLIFPYALAGTNNPSSFDITSTGKWKGNRSSVTNNISTYGIAGITAECSDSVIIMQVSNKPGMQYQYSYNQVKIWWNTWDAKYCIEPEDTSQTLRIVHNDSLQCTIIDLKNEVESVKLKIWRTVKGNKVPFVMMGMHLGKRRGGINYNSIGVNGSSFESYKKCEHFRHQLSQFRPDLFIISIGTNDSYNPDFDAARFEKNYRDFMNMILKINPNCAILLTVPNDCYYKKTRPNPNLVKVEEIIVKLAGEYKQGVWNFYEIMGGFGSSQKWFKQNLMAADRIHFSASGYEIKGDLLTAALLRLWDEMRGRDSTHLFCKYIDQGCKSGYYHSAAWRGEFADNETVPVHVNQTQQQQQQVSVSGNFVYHTIRSGDTLWDIANKYGTTVNRIEQLNPGVNARNLKIGQKIKVKAS